MEDVALNVFQYEEMHMHTLILVFRLFTLGMCTLGIYTYQSLYSDFLSQVSVLKVVVNTWLSMCMHQV